RHPVVAFRPKYLYRFFQRGALIEAVWASTRPRSVLNHLVRKSLRFDHPIHYCTERLEISKADPALRGTAVRPPSPPRSQPMKHLKHSIALVTGTTSGLGREAAR